MASCIQRGSEVVDLPNCSSASRHNQNAQIWICSKVIQNVLASLCRAFAIDALEMDLIMGEVMLD